MEFKILGSLEVWDGPSVIEVGGSKRRALLALLVLHANEVVGKDRLIDELWGEDAPRTAAASLHNHIFRLRKVLGANRLATRAWGYVLRVDPEQVDLHRFEQLIRDAEPLPAKERSDKLARALKLWRGPALADLAFEPALAKDVARLDELRLAVLEARIDADLEAGHNGQIIAELEALIAEHPLREPLRGQLILALYRDGRQAEALEVYRETRRLLADELGLEPSPALRELERAILRQDPALAPIVPPPLVEGTPVVRRRWLVYGALAGATLLAAGGIAALATISRGGSAHPAASSSTSQIEEATGTVVRPAQHPEHAGRASAHTERSQLAERERAKRASVGHPTRLARKIASRPASQASTTRRISRVASPNQPRHSTAPKKAKTEPRQTVFLDDTFSGSTIDSQLWTSDTNGAGVDISQRNGQLDMTLLADATPDPHYNEIAGYYWGACSFYRDFDLRIDYTLLEWPASSGAQVGFLLSLPYKKFVNIDRTSDAAGQEDYSFAAPSGSNVLPTTDTRGTLRMKRVGSLITAYYRSGSHWLSLGSAHRTGAVRVVTGVWASGSDFAHEDISVAFDDFVAFFPRTPGNCG